MSFQFNYPDLLPGQHPITDVIILDTFLDKWGRLDPAHAPSEFGSLCPLSPVMIDRADRPQPYGFFAVLYGSAIEGNIAVGGVRSRGTEGLGTEPAVGAWVQYEKIGLYRHGMTRFHEIRTYWAYDQLVEAGMSVEISLICKHPELGTLYENFQDITEGTNEVVFLVDFNAPYINLQIGVNGGMIFTGLEIVAEPFGRR